MTLVERFVEFNAWTTARKTAVLMCIAVPAQVACLLVVLVLAPPAIANVEVVTGTIAAGFGVIAVVLLASVLTIRAGGEGRWLLYLLIPSYGVTVFSTIYVLGTWTTPALLWPASLVLLLTMVYGSRVGWTCLFLGLPALGAIKVLESLGVLPYAPAVLNRTIDAQATGAWFAAMFPAFLFAYLFSFGFCVLVVSALRLQSGRLQQAQVLIRRYIPSQLADKIIRGEHTGTSKPERAKLTIFFSDLVGFTDIAEELEPEDLTHVLNEYFSEMTSIAHKHGGTIDELTGDAILIFFGAPNATNDKDHALRAARMAIEMQQAMAALNARWRTAGITTVLKARMGIDTGVVTIGHFGSPERMKYAALGKHVNLAARLQAQCESGKVLASHATWLLINDQIACTEKGEMQLKGFRKPVMAYELAVP